jgi:uncharacterized integral membrane protein
LYTILLLLLLLLVLLRANCADVALNVASGKYNV